MVLGLGSRSKKDRATALSQLVDLDLHLHEIKPWHGLARSQKAPTVVSLRWSRGERLIGSSKTVSASFNGSEPAKIAIDEYLRIPVAPNREVLKRAKKTYPELDDPLVFTLVEINNLKGKPLAQAALDFSALASISESKLIAVPLHVSKKAPKGGTSYLHITVQRHQEEKPPPAVPSSATSISSRTSDASSVPPLDEDTQQVLVAALLSDEDEDRGKEEEIDPFTDDDEEYVAHSAPQAMKQPQTNTSVADYKGASSVPPALSQPQGNKQPERVDEMVSRQTVSSPQALPVKVAAIAAATAYASRKHSFLSKGTSSFINESNDSHSDLDSGGEDDFPSQFSRIVPPASVLPTSPQRAGTFQLRASSSAKGSDSVSNVSTGKISKSVNQSDAKDANLATIQQSKDADTDLLDIVVVAKSEFKGIQSVDLKAKSIKAGERKAIGSGKAGEAGEKEEVVGIASSSSMDVPSTFSGLDKSKSNSFQPLEEPRNGLKRDMDSGKFADRVGKKNDMGPRDSVLEAGRGADAKHVAKSSGETKAKVPVVSPLRERGALKVSTSKSPDPTKGRPPQTSGYDPKALKSTGLEGKAKALKSPDRDGATGEAKAAAAEMRIKHLEVEVEKLKGELRDVAAVEAALYATTAEHGSSSVKLHAPARRLARVYLYAFKNWSQERRASCARNTVSGLVLVARACGNDVPRLTFWWSNATVLRETISSAFNVLPSSPKLDANLRSPSDISNLASVHDDGKHHHHHHQQPTSPSDNLQDWTEPSTCTLALERLEGWIFTKVVESIWWQVLTPQMQQPSNDVMPKSDGNDMDMMAVHIVKHDRMPSNVELEDARQGNISVDIWKRAFLDAYERLCPVRSLGVECGCLPMLSKLVLQACVARLDVAMFNAIIRDEEAPTDPVSDPISDAHVLPIPNSTLSFGLGAQLKNAVATLTSFLSNMSGKDEDTSVCESEEAANLAMFPLLKATGGLLMIPKEMLMDKSLRKEVCPTLSLPFIGRILSKFQPDEFSPDPIAPELLDTINAEIAEESQEQGEMDDSFSAIRMAFAPSVIYSPPSSSVVRHWIRGPAGTMAANSLSRSNSSVLRKSYTSDDEIDEMESPITWLLENTGGGSLTGVAGSPNERNGIKAGAIPNSLREGDTNCRFMLLREVWNSG